MQLQLYIGNKNYSSWSMRPWVLMTHFAIPFEEIRLTLDFADDSEFKRRLARLAPSGKVPLLVDDGFAIWDSLAIVEYLAERFPDEPVWPRDVRLRARARSLCAEMHSGFATLRSLWQMNIEASLQDVGARTYAESSALRDEVGRIESMWREALEHSGGPFLMGGFGAVDAFFAPVCMRLRTYAPSLPDDIAAYVARVSAAPGVARWIAEALDEHSFIEFEEPYRKRPV
jgi:glutathione S-transferase